MKGRSSGWEHWRRRWHANNEAGNVFLLFDSLRNFERTHVDGGNSTPQPRWLPQPVTSAHDPAAHWVVL
jgi:hypothetical protein